MTEKSQARRAIVIGGSIAGLFVGAFLRRIGWRVDVYERSSIELIGRGAGIFASHLELFEALDKCGAGTVDIGVIAYKRVTFDRSGKVIAEKPLLQIVTSWDRLRQVLLKAIDRQRYHFGYVFERVAMRLKIAALSAVSAAVMFFSMGVFAQAADAIALKSGETVELGNLFWAANCRSLLKGAMTVEVLEGPPEVTASIREQKVIPHIQNCAKPVDGGILLLTAPKEIKERKQAKVILRVKYPTVDGERQKSHDIDLTLVP